MKKFLLAVSCFAFMGATASFAQTSTTTSKDEVKIESTAPKTCSGHNMVSNSESPKSCCNSQNKTSCNGSTTMTSNDGGKKDCDPKTCDHKHDKKKNKDCKMEKNSTSCNTTNSNKNCCSGHKE